MAVTALIYGAIAVGASVAASQVQRKNKAKATLRDAPTTTSVEPGQWLPLLIGRRRLGYNLGWAGKRFNSTDGDGDTDTLVYKEHGWHQICVGPADVLHGIYLGTKNILLDPLSRETHPSGTEVGLRGGGAFTIYWGDDDQPIDAFLSQPDVLGIASQWPRVCHGRYRSFPLGTNESATWPADLTYDIECYGTEPVIPGVERVIAETNEVTADGGINPGHAMWQVLTAPWPNGIHMEPALIDGGAVIAVGLQTQNEHLPSNIVAADGIGADELINSMMLDYGFMLVQNRDLLTPYMIRQAVGDLPALTADMIVASKAERTRVHGVSGVDQVAYTFRDRKRNYGENSISLRNDPRARNRRRQSVTKVGIETVTDASTAFKIAARRSLERIASTEYDGGIFLRGARNLLPGQAYLDAEGRQQRASKVELMPLASSGAKVTAVLDQYTYGPPNYAPTYDDDAALPDNEAAPDLAVLAMINQIGRVWVFRVRANQSVSGAYIWIRPGELQSYDRHSQNQQWPAAGGTLNKPLDGSDAIVEEGPTITAFPNGDILTVPIDLTGQDSAWEANRQLLCCEGELMSLRKVTAVSGGWRLDGIRRGVLGTDVAAHPIGATVYIIRQQLLTDIALSSSITLSEAVRLKTQPYTSSARVDLQDVESVEILP
ncbi:MAG TPA: hypothetical protein VGN72_10035 [Tepidisphaeraceae bacterium]|jgi:hypothetical protein|nr:hypothetical protein [Tepidisphaeraceae bacterium]